MELTGVSQAKYPITTIVLESAAWITKTMEVSHDAGWLPGQLFFGLLGGADTEDTKIPLLTLLEKDLVGKTVHDTYDLDEALIVNIPQPGDQIALRLVDGASIEKGDCVISAGSGNVRAYTDSDEITSILGIAMADLDLTGDNEGGVNLFPVLIF